MTDEPVSMTRNADGTYTVCMNGRQYDKPFDTQLKAAEFIEWVLYGSETEADERCQE